MIGGKYRWEVHPSHRFRLPLEAEGALQKTGIADYTADLAKTRGVRQAEARIGEVDIVEQVISLGAE